MPTKVQATPKTRPVRVAQAPAPAPRRSASDFLLDASNTIASRGQERDTSTEGQAEERSMAAAVLAFNAIEGTALSERQGWTFMAVLKLVRAHAAVVNGRANPDDYIDGPAYFALAGESLGFKQAPQR